MQQNQLMKWTAVFTALFTALVMTVMLYYSINKVVVVTGVAQDEIVHSIGTAPQDKTPESVQDRNQLIFDRSSKNKQYFCIPLSSDITAEDVMIENHYMDKELWVSIRQEKKEDTCENFYRTHGVSGKCDEVVEGYFENAQETFWLKFRLRGVYEYSSIFEDNNLYIEFMTPKEVYNKIVIIDPAYGGNVLGAVSGDAKSKSVALEIARALKKKMDDTDIKVYYTRMSDIDVTEEKRVALTRETMADMLIRIEVNESTDNRTLGTEAVYNGMFFIPKFGNVELADLLEREVVTAISGKANGLFEATEQDEILQKTQIPAATIRVGYITHEKEAVLLCNEDYVQKIAEGIYRAILKAYEMYEEN